MNEKELAALQPAEQTGAAIRAALSRIASAKTSAQSRARDAQAELDEKMKGGTLTSAHRRKLEDIVHDQQQDVVMLDALAGQVEAPLADIELVERDERLGAARVALRDEMAALDAKWAAEYPPLHEALQKLLAERIELIERINAHSDEAQFVLKRVDLADFQLPTSEVRLLQTPEQRAEAAVPYWQRERRAVNDAVPKPTITIGGEVQTSGQHTWHR